MAPACTIIVIASRQRRCSDGIDLGRTSNDDFPPCPPSWVIREQATHTGTSRLALNAWERPPSTRAKVGAVNMKPTASFAALLERFFTQRLMTQRQVSSNTIASYRDTFRLLLEFAQKRLGRPPAALALADFDAPLISAFLDDLEHNRGVIVRTRNLRLTAIRSFFRYAAYQEPASSGQIQQILSIPSKRHDRRLVDFLTRVEIDALLAAPNLKTWDGRRDRGARREWIDPARRAPG